MKDKYLSSFLVVTNIVKIVFFFFYLSLNEEKNTQIKSKRLNTAINFHLFRLMNAFQYKAGKACKAETQ